MTRSMVVLLTAAFVLLQWLSAHADEAMMRRNKILWESMSSEEKDRVIRSYHEWKSSPPQRKERIRRNYDTFNDLSPEEKRMLRARYRNLNSLRPSVRERVREKINRVESLPPENRAEIEKRYLKERERSADERMRHLQGSRFWKDLSDEERDIFKKLINPME